jgi:hypothetical protein
MNTKRTLLLIAVMSSLIVILCSFRSIPLSLAVDNPSHSAYVPDEVIVKFKSDIQKALVAQTIDNIGGRFISYQGSLIQPQSWRDLIPENCATQNESFVAKFEGGGRPG